MSSFNFHIYILPIQCILLLNLYARVCLVLGSLSSDVFELRTSTGSEPFSLLVSLDATVFILPSVLILKETICPKICSKSRLKCAKSPFPVDVRRSKTSLLKLPIIHCEAPGVISSFSSYNSLRERAWELELKGGREGELDRRLIRHILAALSSLENGGLSWG